MPEPSPDLDLDRGAPRTPRWVKVFGIVALIVLLLFLALLLTRGAGGHGPQRHFSSGGGAAADPADPFPGQAVSDASPDDRLA